MLEGELLSMDLMLVAPNLESVWKSRIRLQLESAEISVVSKEWLARMKRMAVRLKALPILEV